MKPPYLLLLKSDDLSILFLRFGPGRGILAGEEKNELSILFLRFIAFSDTASHDYVDYLFQFSF